MKKDSKSKKMSEYDEAVVKKYEKYVGKKELSKLVGAFDSKKFAGNWKQVMCSPSTSVLGSGPNFSSVEATYKLKKDGVVGVKNDAYDNDFYRVSITGASRARDEEVPTCRTVEFNNLFNIEGDYWLIYATPSFKTVIVAAPIMVKLFNRPFVITNNFGFYVLTRDRKHFWSSSREHKNTFHALEKYGFNKPWNKPVATAETFDLN
jgi:lipocalin